MSQDTTTVVASNETATVAPVAKPAKAKVAKRIGRPPLYKGNVLKHIASLIRKHNAATAMRILRAKAGSEDAKLRNENLIPEPLTISQPTLLKIAANANIELSVGRPKLKKAA